MSLEKEIIDYKQNESEILHWEKLKGIYRYESIISFLKSKGIECTWKNITYYIKYDKRILINSFKYIVFLEELYKSFIASNKNIIKSELLGLEFSRALDKFLSLGEKAEFDNMNLDLLRKEKKTINTYRNQVVHNKILLNHKYNGKTLDEVLNIVYKILPESYRKGYARDINSCSKGLLDSLWHIQLNVGNEA